MCAAVSANEKTAVDAYFTSCDRRSQSNSRSASSDFVVINDLDSEGSKETIPEKQSNEEGEKGEVIEENGQEKEVNVEKEGKHIKRKHESDPKIVPIPSEDELCRPWAMETNENEASLPAPHPCKKRPVSQGSNVYEDSLHRCEEGGMSIEDFVKHVKSMKRKGMYEEYARIKQKPPMGTFTASK